MSNRGYEIQVSWRDNVGTDFWYEVGGQVSYAVNKIDYKAEPSYMYAWMNETGFAYGQYKAYYNEGFYNTPEEVANHPYNAIDGNRVQGGDLRIVDVNGDGIIDDKDITPTGFSNVPRFAFSSNLSFGYKGFEISALLTGSAQGTFNMNGYLITPFAQGNGTPLSYMNGRWTPERHAAGKHITFPRMSVNMANSQNNQNNAFWFRSTDHIKLKNVEVAYTFRNARWDAQGAYRLDPRIRQCQQPLYLGRQRPGRRHRAPSWCRTAVRPKASSIRSRACITSVSTSNFKSQPYEKDHLYAFSACCCGPALRPARTGSSRSPK